MSHLCQGPSGEGLIINTKTQGFMKVSQVRVKTKELPNLEIKSKKQAMIRNQEIKDAWAKE